MLRRRARAEYSGINMEDFGLSSHVLSLDELLDSSGEKK